MNNLPCNFCPYMCPASVNFWTGGNFTYIPAYCPFAKSNNK